ncbi:PadR family transcriptional regulator [bacterium]|nr:PadR family transcriptional regulator [bacterium]
MKRLTPDEVLLGLLKAHPAHGYDLLERFRSPAHLGRVWNMSTSQLYAVLKRLERDGAITGREQPQPDAPPRTKYALTSRGEDRLAAWLADPAPPTSIHRIRVLFLSRLYIATLLGQPTERLIAHQLAVCEAQRETLQDKAADPASSVEALTLRFVIGQLNAAIAWIHEVEAHPLVLPDQDDID